MDPFENRSKTGAKSAQRGVAASTVQTVTISPVDIKKCRVYVNGSGKDSSGIVQQVIGGYLTNSTTLTTGGSSGYTGGGSYWWEVIEDY